MGLPSIYVAIIADCVFADLATSYYIYLMSMYITHSALQQGILIILPITNSFC